MGILQQKKQKRKQKRTRRDQAAADAAAQESPERRGSLGRFDILTESLGIFCKCHQWRLSKVGQATRSGNRAFRQLSANVRLRKMAFTLKVGRDTCNVL